MQGWKLGATLVWTAASCCGADRVLAVVLFDYAGASRGVLEMAAETAHDALATAGVKTDWTVCEVSRDPRVHCALPAAGTYIGIKILPPALEGGLQRREGLGYAMKCAPEERCATAWVFHRAVAALAEAAGRPVPLALAYVMIHEIGHLMGMGHEPSGIMKAGFDKADMRDAAMGRLRFTTKDAERLVASVAGWTNSVRAGGIIERR